MATKQVACNNLDRSDLKVSKVISGAISDGSSAWREWVLDGKEFLPLLKHASHVGTSTWGTADMYSNGTFKQIISKALKQYDIPRNKVTVTSECYVGVTNDGTHLPMAEIATNDNNGVNQVGLSRKRIMYAMENSVQRLGT